MESSNYEKQILIYGRHAWDAVGCSVGSDGRSGDRLRSGLRYVTLRGGWLFGGGAKGDYTVSAHPESNKSLKENIKNAWLGSGEFSVSCFDERVSVGLKLGYFTGKATFECRVAVVIS